MCAGWREEVRGTRGLEEGREEEVRLGRGASPVGVRARHRGSAGHVGDRGGRARVRGAAAHPRGGNRQWGQG